MIKNIKQWKSENLHLNSPQIVFDFQFVHCHNLGIRVVTELTKPQIPRPVGTNMVEKSGFLLCTTGQTNLNQFEQLTVSFSSLQIACAPLSGAASFSADLRSFLTFPSAVGPLGVSDVAVLTALTVEASGVVQAANALPTIRLAHAGRPRWVHVPVAVTPHADAVGVIVAVVALVAVRARVASLAFVTPWGGFTRL